MKTVITAKRYVGLSKDSKIQSGAISIMVPEAVMINPMNASMRASEV
jgi:hypothetical protein